MKNAWLMTHDTYVDRRIFFFADVLTERGYNVKLFADEYFDALCMDDPEYVIRPEVKADIRRYAMPSEEVPKGFLNIVTEINAYQDKYFSKCKKWSDKIPRLPEEVRTLVYKDDYVVTFELNDQTICYDRKTDSYMSMLDSEFISELSACEKAASHLLNGQRPDEIEKQLNVQLKMSDKQDRIFIHPYYSRLLYVYDCASATLTEYKPMQRVDGDLDVSNERYRDFQIEIYDYDRIFSRIKKELEQECPDVVYVADVTTLPIAIMLKEKYGCKIIMDCHEWWYKQTVLWEPESEKKQLLSDKYEKELYPKCDLRITVGKYLAGRMQETIGCDFEVIYSCMNSELSNVTVTEELSLKDMYGLKETDKVAIFQGGMSSHRNLENLARATKYFDEDCYLLLLTTGEFESTFRKILNNEGNPKRVIWGGWIPQKDLLKYTALADLGIIPYVAENDYAECFVPNKLMEYFTVKIPILFDNSLQELKMVAGDNEVGCGTDLRNPKIFGETICELLHDDSKLMQYRNNYNNCGSKFDFKSQKVLFEQMLDKYKI